jgi:hypothetical protein
LLDLVAFGNHALFVSIIVLNLNAALLMAGCARPDRCTGDSAARRADSSAMTAAERSAKPRAKRSAADSFKQTGLISGFRLPANLLIRILLATRLFHLKLFKRLALRGKRIDRWAHRRTGAGRKRKHRAAKSDKSERLHGVPFPTIFKTYTTRIKTNNVKIMAATIACI